MSVPQSALPAGANPGERYYRAFDGIRAVAACMVFVDHYGALPYWGHGVSIFFVLSGFLITGVLYDAKDTLKRFRTFYIRRSLRIFPVYYAFWIVMLALTPLLHVQWNHVNLLYVVYAGNHVWGMFSGAPEDHVAWVHLLIRPFSFFGKVHEWYPLYIGHFWTLSVEEQFYLVWPLVVFNVRSRIKLIRICVAAIVILFVARIVTVLWLPLHINLITHITILRCDEFLLGGGAALVLRGGRAQQLLRKGWVLFAAGAVGVAASCTICYHIGLNSYLHEMQWAFTVQTAMFDVLAVGSILLAMQERTWLARGLSWAPLRALGRISYGFYLFHDIPHTLYDRAVRLLAARLPFEINEQVVVAVLAFVCTVVLASLSYRFLERPFLQLKNRWAPSGAERHSVAGNLELGSAVGRR
ncbi:MAG TPA: acyltransferase [Acidobacteriaceae bacterium]